MESSPQVFFGQGLRRTRPRWRDQTDTSINPMAASTRWQQPDGGRPTHDRFERSVRALGSGARRVARIGGLLARVRVGREAGGGIDSKKTPKLKPRYLEGQEGST